MILGMSSTLIKLAEHQRKQVERLKKRSAACLATLSPEFRRRVLSVMSNLEKGGAVPVVYWGKRTLKQQQEIVKEGHSPSTKSWHVETYHRNEYHNGTWSVVHGEAADIVDARYLWKGPCANLNHPFWTALGRCAKAEGLEWGGDWKPPIKRDVAHVQMKTREFIQDTRGSFA
jgi:peptidoglycan L-alanyl-D-glutamate endopeptidase CwlK